jgi:hypothetical protein
MGWGTGSELDTRPDEHLSSTAFSFAMRASQIDSIDDLASETLHAVLPLGMTAVASGMVTGQKALSSQPLHFTSWPRDWLEHYVARGFIMTDP